MQRILNFAGIFKLAASGDIHKWAANIVNQAFESVMGRLPTPAERQIVMAVSSLESGYGRGWGKGKSTGGQGSHNWGAVQTRSKTAPGFTHGDSSAEGKYTVRFKAYPNDVAGAADVVSLLFKGTRKQHEPVPERKQRAMGKPIDGPGRGELIAAAAQQGDTLAFSKAMWYTTYYEGIAPEFTKRIQDHAKAIQSKVDRIAASLGETPAWGLRISNYLPVTNDRAVIERIIQMNPKAAGGGFAPTPQIEQRPSTNIPLKPQGEAAPLGTGDAQTKALEDFLWFR